jgi:hypothetical protein
VSRPCNAFNKACNHAITIISSRKCPKVQLLWKGIICNYHGHSNWGLMNVMLLNKLCSQCWSNGIFYCILCFLYPAQMLPTWCSGQGHVHKPALDPGHSVLSLGSQQGPLDQGSRVMLHVVMLGSNKSMIAWCWSLSIVVVLAGMR